MNRNLNKITKVAFPLFAVFSLLLAACASLPQPGNATRQGTAVSNTGTVSQVSTASSVDSTGKLEALQTADLYWKTNGQVESVNVKPGDKVQAGDLLMILKTTSAPANVISAQAELINAQQALKDLYDTNYSLAEAELALANAQDAIIDKDYRVQSLSNPADPTDVEVAQATVYTAQSSMDKAWDRYEPWKGKAETNIIRATLYQRYAQSKQVYDDAVRRLNNLLGTSSDTTKNIAQADFELAQANLVEAQKRVDELKAGADPEDVKALQSRIDAAQATVDSLFVTAPFDGEILVVNYLPGDVTTTAIPAVQMANRDQYHVEVQVDETEIGNIKPGNTVNIRLDSLPKEELTGVVSEIKPIGNLVQGVVKYPVIINLDQTDLPLLLGGTANVTIQTSDSYESLAVPLETIQTDAQGEFVIRVNPDGTTERVDIQTGLIQNSLVLVDGELQVGDVLQLAPSSNAFSGMPGFGQSR